MPEIGGQSSPQTGGQALAGTPMGGMPSTGGQENRGGNTSADVARTASLFPVWRFSGCSEWQVRPDIGDVQPRPRGAVDPSSDGPYGVTTTDHVVQSDDGFDISLTVFTPMLEQPDAAGLPLVITSGAGLHIYGL